jgi:hypothetical protein
VGNEEQQLHVRRVGSREDMRELASATFIALERAGLPDAMDQLLDRVFTLTPEQLFESALTTGGVARWSFKPMVELLLRHIGDVAAQDTVPSEERLRRIGWAIHASGF